MPLAFRSYHTLPRTSHWIPRRVGWDVGAGVGLAEGGRVVGAVATAAAAPASCSRDCDECCTPALVLPAEVALEAAGVGDVRGGGHGLGSVFFRFDGLDRQLWRIVGHGRSSCC